LSHSASPIESLLWNIYACLPVNLLFCFLQSIHLFWGFIIPSWLLWLYSVIRVWYGTFFSLLFLFKVDFSGSRHFFSHLSLLNSSKKKKPIWVGHGGIHLYYQKSEAESGGWKAQGQPKLHIEFQASLNYVARPCLKQKKKFTGNSD
jgi:hypothetical protein